MMITISNTKFSLLFLCIILFGSIQSIQDDPDYYRYLQQFGYTPKVEGRRLFSVLAKSSYSEGILKLQRLFKLPETGQLDERTRSFMQKARCGNPDLGTYESIRRPLNIDLPHNSYSVQGRSGKGKAPESYVTQTGVWPKKNLKWFIEVYPQNQKQITSHDEVRRIFDQAFNDWQKYSGLKFEMAKNAETADLKIKFQSRDHGDGYPFDGPGTTLAHAFYPKSGDIHFDDDEKFTNKYKNQHEEYTLRLVAAHEIGHALGLSHSFEPESLMYPVYQQFNSSYVLSNDDQQGIQSLYGKPEIKIESTTSRVKLTPSFHTTFPASTALPMNNWCEGEFQTGCEGPDGELYLFKDNQVWRYQAKTKRIWDSKPTLIHERFPSLTPDTTITACVRSSMGYTYLFRNYRMWKLKTHWSSEGPTILYGKHYPQNPRLALLHQNSVYLIRNRLIYRLNEFDYDQDLEIRTINSILNPPPEDFIRSGFTYAKRHYLFTKDLVYVYDSSTGNLLAGYPKPSINGWFACEAASNDATNWRKTSSTTKDSIRKSNENQDRDDEDDYQLFRHHHHHHRHPHRPRRPFFHRRPVPGPGPGPAPPSALAPVYPPYQYRRRWDE